MKKIILTLSLIIIATITIFISCNKNESDNTISNRISNSLKSSSDFWEKGLEPGIVYDFYTIIDSSDLAYKTSLMLENDTLNIAECKIKATDIPEGSYTEASIGFIGVNNDDIIYRDTLVECTFRNTMCEIPIGFSSVSSQKECGGFPKIYSRGGAHSWWCYCWNQVYNVSGDGNCNIDYISNSRTACRDCGCVGGDKRCYIKHTEINNSGCGLQFGALYVKASTYKIVSSL